MARYVGLTKRYACEKIKETCVDACLLDGVVPSAKCGPVAQLGARFHGMEEVVGSIPTRSTNILPSIYAGFLHINPRKELT